MTGVLGPLYLRIPVLVVVAFASSQGAEMIGLPLALRSAIFWGLALSLPVTVLLMFSVILLWILSGSSVEERFTDKRGDIRLLIISLAGYTGTFACGGFGGVLAPSVFPV